MKPSRTYKKSSRTYKVVGFVCDHQTRYMCVSITSHRPSTAMGLYEAYLHSKGQSPNTRRNAMSSGAYLYTWGETCGVDIEHCLLSGDGFRPRDIRAFVHWLRHTYENRSDERLSTDTVRSVIVMARAATTYFIEQYHDPAGASRERGGRLALVVKAQRAVWDSVVPVQNVLSAAPDLTDEEIQIIDAWIDPVRREAAGVRPEVAHRDLLMWRLTRVGLRIGEGLALRLIDCPQLRGELLRIVRIEERGKQYHDPRQPYAPRPKTLSRELGVHMYDPQLPRLLASYISTYRYVRLRVGQDVFNDWELSHDFLLISHTTGQPLSVWAAQDVADQITLGTGINFHWHLARHSFFNRRYAEIADLPNYQALRTDLLYWGGWRNPRSLDIYTRRATAQRAADRTHNYRNQFRKGEA